jgi:Spy/CpxP family protein refolding chaperone
LVLAALFSASISRAELPGEPHLERMKTELKLSDQQAREVRKIFDEVRPQWEALRQQRRELQEKTRERLKSVLTPEQMQQFDKIHEEHKAHRKLGRHGRS